MKNDIESTKDIQLLVETFCSRLKAHQEIGFIFNNIAQVNWDKHVLSLCSFFENMLFYTGSYIGNPMQLHHQLHRLQPLTTEHFTQWTTLFNSSVDELFAGEKAELVKLRVKRIATVMQIKIQGDNEVADKIF